MCMCCGTGTSSICLPTAGMGAGPRRTPHSRHLHSGAGATSVFTLSPPLPNLLLPLAQCLPSHAALAVPAGKDGGVGQVAEVAAASLISALLAALTEQLAAKRQPNKWLDCPVISY